MIEFIGLSPQNWTPAALLAVVVLMIVFGWLIPRWTVKSIVQDRDDWKALAMDLTGTNHELIQAVRENTEPAKTVAKVMTAAQDRLEESGSP